MLPDYLYEYRYGENESLNAPSGAGCSLTVVTKGGWPAMWES